jgi:hypothetical protein
MLPTAGAGKHAPLDARDGARQRGTSAAAPSATAEELWQQADAASDPKEKGRLAAQALKLTEGKVHSIN